MLKGYGRLIVHTEQLVSCVRLVRTYTTLRSATDVLMMSE